MSGRKESERTLQMKKNYIKDWRDGKTPVEIAKKYGLSVNVVYKNLADIAKEAGLIRDELLERPTSKHGVAETTHVVTEEKQIDARQIDAKCLEESFEVVGKAVDKLCELIRIEIQQSEDYLSSHN